MFSKPLPLLVQYPLKPEAKEGVKPTMEVLLKQGFIIPCMNTPALPGKKPYGTDTDLCKTVGQ